MGLARFALADRLPTSLLITIQLGSDLGELKKPSGTWKKVLVALSTRPASLSYENLIFALLFLRMRSKPRFRIPSSVRGRPSIKMEPNFGDFCVCCCIRHQSSLARKNQYCVNWFAFLLSCESSRSTVRRDYDARPYGRKGIFLEESQIFLSRESPSKRARSTNARKNSTIGKSNQQFPPFLPERKHPTVWRLLCFFVRMQKNSRDEGWQKENLSASGSRVRKKKKSFIGNFFFVLQCYQMS